jgi:hypothetical protein
MKGRCAVLGVLLTSLSACELAVVGAPVPEPIAVSLQVMANSDTSIAVVLAKVDRAWLEFTRGSVTLDTIVPVYVGEGSVLTRLQLTPPDGEGALTVRAELRRASNALFEGSATVSGDRSGVVRVRPVASHLGAVTVPSFVDALGDTVVLSGSVRFATGDIWDGASPTWSSEDSGVLEVQSNLRAIPRGNGTTRLVLSFEQLEQRFTVRVTQEPVELWGVGPTDTTVVVGSQFALRAFGQDRTAMPLLPGARVTWVAGGGVSVDSLGLATALVAGDGFVHGLLGTVRHSASITVVPVPGG